MAIAFDNYVADSTSTNPTSTRTFNSAATGSAANMMAFVIVYCGNSVSVSSVTWGGTAMTKISGPSGTIDGVGATLFALYNPGSGVKSIVATLSGNSSGMTTFASTYSGVTDNLATDATALYEAASGVGNISDAITTVNNNSWSIITTYSNVAYSASTNVTLRQKGLTGPSTRTLGYGDSGGAITPAGAYTMSMTRDGGGTGLCERNLFSIYPYVSPSTAPLFALEATFFQVGFAQNILAATLVLLGETRSIWSSLAKNVSTWVNQSKS